MVDVESSALAAAVAAAAELAKNGCAAFLFPTTPNAIPDGGEQDGLASTLTTATANSTMRIAEQLYADNMTTTDDDNKAKRTHDVSSNNNDSAHPADEGDEDDHHHHPNDEDDEDGDEPDAEQRLARSRERNREHARRTRLRKKAQLEALQARVKGLEAEGRTLRQSLEECNIASILVGLSGGTSTVEETEATQGDQTTTTLPDESKIALLVAGKRKRFLSEDLMEKSSQPLKLHIDGQTTLIGGGKTHINWKTGVYSDENGVHRQLTSEQLESLRRERNRMHAKMTRDRKKCFIKTIESTIDELERENKRLRSLLSTKATTTTTTAVTPQPSPMLTASVAVVSHAFVQDTPMLSSATSSAQSSTNSSPCPTPPPPSQSQPPVAVAVGNAVAPDTVPSEQERRRVTHGFSLIG